MIPQGDAQLAIAAAAPVHRWAVSLPCGAPRRRDLRWLYQRIVKRIVATYMRLFHDITVRYHPDIPRGSAYIAVMSHTSNLDMPALLAVDPYDPPTTMVIKQEWTRMPLVGFLFDYWGAIAVSRRGNDIASLRSIRRLLATGRGLCVAPGGTRNRDGRLGPLSPVLIRVILGTDVPVFPAVIVGTRECMPPGAKLPRPGKIHVETGAAIDLTRFRGRGKLGDAEIAEAALAIRDAISTLLPDYMKPLPDTPVLGRYLAVDGVTSRA